MWNLTYTPTNSSSDPSDTKVVLIRTGFSTHAVSHLTVKASHSSADSSADELWPTLPRAQHHLHPTSRHGSRDGSRLANAPECKHLPTRSGYDLPRCRWRPVPGSGKRVFQVFRMLVDRGADDCNRDRQHRDATACSSHRPPYILSHCRPLKYIHC